MKDHSTPFLIFKTLDFHLAVIVAARQPGTVEATILPNEYVHLLAADHGVPNSLIERFCELTNVSSSTRIILDVHSGVGLSVNAIYA